MARRPKADPLPTEAAEFIHALHTNSSDVVPPGPLAINVPLTALRPSTTNARHRYDPDRLKGLAASIEQHGILEPLLVRPHTVAHCYEIVAGERRYRAAQAAGVVTAPVIVRQLTDEDVLEFSLIENLQRDDLTPMEQARGFHALIEANPTKHTPASIAGRIGVTERWLWDRLKLLDLTKVGQQHLEHERMPVSHAIVLAKLKPADQARAIDHALFVDEGPTLIAGASLKVVSLRELEAWIAHHVRFDVEHAGVAAPLEFGPVVDQVGAASADARPVVAITHDPFVPADARNGGTRTYTPVTWKRADGQDGSKRCGAAVLGVVAVGRGYGSAFDVCVDKACDVHWKRERLARAKPATETSAESTKQEQHAAAQRRAYDEELARDQEWRTAIPELLDAVTAAIAKAPASKVVAFVAGHDAVTAWLKPKKTPMTADACLRLVAAVYVRRTMDDYRARHTLPRVLAKAFGVNLAPVLKQAAAKKAKDAR